MFENVKAYKFNLLDKKAKTDIFNSCNFPHKAATIDVEGDCMICTCDGWLPIGVCNILDIDRLEQIWDNDTAHKIQKDVDDKKFTWCSVDHCGIRKMNQIMERHSLSINIDEGCNLACPSCRSGKINYTAGAKYETRSRVAKQLVSLINKFDNPLEIMMSGNGDPFASLIYRPLLLDMEPRDNIQIRMLTNGLLLKKIMPRVKVKDSIKHLDISIDAGDKETYEKVRRGGSWNLLIDNLDYVKKEFDCEVTLKFVLQRDNIDSVENFIALMDDYGFSGNIMPLEDWSSMKNFSDHDVLSPDHPLNARAMQLLDRYRNHKRLFLHSI